jgi:hypothetical protein
LDSVPEWNDFEDASLSSSFAQPIVYNDFGSNLIGDMEVTVTSSTSTSESVQLSERMSLVQDRQVRQTAIDARNWKLGNWQVRGLSLEDSNSIVTVTRIVQTAEPISNTDGTDKEESDASNDGTPLVWVGRSDGSIWAVRLGTEYWTKLGLVGPDNNELLPQPNESWSSSDSSSSTTRMPWSESDEKKDEDDDDDEFLAAVSPKVLRPSRVVARLVANDDATPGRQRPIVALVAVPLDNDKDEATLVFATRAAQPSNVIDAWQVTIPGEADHSDNDRAAFAKTQALVGGHDDGQSIVALQVTTAAAQGLQLSGGGHHLLVSMDRSGGVALWNAATGLLQARFSASSDTLDDANPSIHSNLACSLWVTSSHILVGTSTGQVLAYATAELLKSSNNDDATVPERPVVVATRWRASDHAITSMAGGGPGVMGNNSGGQSRTTVLFTGDAQGLVKRWELLSGGGTGTSTRLDAWPKLATQRLPKRAHVFSGHDDGVTALRAIDGTKFVSAGLDGTGTLSL